MQLLEEHKDYDQRQKRSSEAHFVEDIFKLDLSSLLSSTGSNAILL